LSSAEKNTRQRSKFADFFFALDKEISLPDVFFTLDKEISFSKYIVTNLEKHVMEKKEEEGKKGLPSAPNLALGKHCFAECQI